MELFSDSQVGIRPTAHLDTGPGQQLGRAMNKHARALCAHRIDAAVHWVPGNSGIPGNEDADRQGHKARDDRGCTVHEPMSTSAGNRAGRISEWSTAAKAEWDAASCSKHYGYRVKGKAGSKRPVPMISVKSLATRFYRLESWHAPTGTYLKRFRHYGDDKCWWCRGGTLQTRELLFHHCSQWKDQQKVLWKAVWKATGWKAGRCRHVQTSELFSMKKCDQAVMDFLAATDIGKFPPKQAKE